MFYDLELKSEELSLALDKTTDAVPEKEWLPAYHFRICLPDGTEVGQCDLRIGHNRRTYIGGNIGYRVDPAHRGHHFAAKTCLLLFELARKHDLGYVIITCTPENAASARTCELAGGTFIEITDIPEDDPMYAEGKRKVMVYRFMLS